MSMTEDQFVKEVENHSDAWWIGNVAEWIWENLLEELGAETGIMVVKSRKLREDEVAELERRRRQSDEEARIRRWARFAEKCEANGLDPEVVLSTLP
jgi:hypothetical protein